jgi:hypothetical protein
MNVEDEPYAVERLAARENLKEGTILRTELEHVRNPVNDSRGAAVLRRGVLVLRVPADTQPGEFGDILARKTGPPPCARGEVDLSWIDRGSPPTQGRPQDLPSRQVGIFRRRKHHSQKRCIHGWAIVSTGDSHVCKSGVDFF